MLRRALGADVRCVGSKAVKYDANGRDYDAVFHQFCVETTAGKRAEIGISLDGADLWVRAATGGPGPMYRRIRMPQVNEAAPCLIIPSLTTRRSGLLGRRDGDGAARSVVAEDVGRQVSGAGRAPVEPRAGRAAARVAGRAAGPVLSVDEHSHRGCAVDVQPQSATGEALNCLAFIE